MGGLAVAVNGVWQQLEGLPGDITMSTCWPGGSDQLTWTPGVPDEADIIRGGMTVLGAYCGVPVWAGSMSEPDPSTGQLTAVGAWREAENFVALDSLGAATKVPDTAVDQAKVRGLNWTRPTSLASTNVASDITQGPMMLSALLDTFAENTGVSWGVDPIRQLYAKADDTSPTYQTLPLDGGLGFAMDNYASTLISRYLDAATSTYKTVTVTDSVAEANHGHREVVVDLTVRGAISTTTATNITTNMLSVGRAVPQWTAGITLAYGELLSMGGAPVALETVAAGVLLRVQSGAALAQRLNGAMYLDIPIGRTTLAGGLLTLEPADMVVGTLADAITAALTKK